MTKLQTILFATDFSKSSECAFGLACSLARDYGARLAIVHVATPPPVVLPDEVVVSFHKGTYVNDLKKRLYALRPPDTSIRIDYYFEQGDPATEILRVARVAGADWIVMGTHGSTGLFRLLMGSVAEEVLRGAPCPVLAVRMPSAKSESRSADSDQKKGKSASQPAPS